MRNPTWPALLFAVEAKPEQGRFNARKMGGGTRICGAEYPGGRGGHGVAGAFTSGIRNGAFPFRVILLDAPLRSSVNTMPLSSLGRRSRNREGLYFVLEVIGTRADMRHKPGAVSWRTHLATCCISAHTKAGSEGLRVSEGME